MSELASPPGRIVVEVDADLRELIPEFLDRRTMEAAAATEACRAGDFARLRELGHTLKGVGGSFGFHAITDLGRELEKAAAACDAGRAGSLVSELSSYLDRVEVVYA